MENEMKTGSAYAFLDYSSNPSILLEAMKRHLRINGFRENATFKVLDDRLNDSLNHQKVELPLVVAKAAETLEVYGSVPMTKIGNLVELEPVKASSLRYILKVEVPEASDSEIAEPLGQSRANRLAAQVLNQVLSTVGNRAYRKKRIKNLRFAVFYKNSRGRAERYP
jgi:hypothetical protein